MSYRLLVRSACDCARAWAPRGASAIARFGGCRFYTEMVPAHETHWAGIARKDADVSLSPPTQAANVQWRVQWLKRRHKQSPQGEQKCLCVAET